MKRYYSQLTLCLVAAFCFLGTLQAQINQQKNSNHQGQPAISLSDAQRQHRLGQIKESSIPAFLSRMAESGLITNSDTEYLITSEHISSISGINHQYYRQAIGGIEVLGTESSLHVMSDGNMIMAHNKFVKELSAQLNRSSASLTAEAAIRSVAQKKRYGSPVNLSQTKSLTGVDQHGEYNHAGISQYNIPVRQVYTLTENGVRLAWELSIAELDSSDWFNYLVDANSGDIISQVNWTVSCLNDVEHDHDHGHDDTHLIDDAISSRNNAESTTASALLPDTYNVYPMPVESPNHGSRSSVVNPHNTTASPFGWHDTNGVAGAESNYTIGNNCDAYDDSSSTVSGTGSGVNSERAWGGSGPALVFNYPINTNVTVGDGSIDAAVTNLFYWTNVIHDVLYFYGFDEAAGNFQENTYGNGGTGGDLVWAEAQDGSGTCNANFATPPDGGNPRMQMYVCGTRDGDLDNAVIVHEYGHGISNRLTGGPANAGALQNAEQMGEGWSDYYGLMLTMTASDTRTQARGIGTWLVGQAANGPGIRPAPYSTSTGVNNFTYADVSDSGTISQPHGIGFIWSTMLWEMTWDLIDLYGFDADFYQGTGGNNIAMNLVTEGMKLQAASPGFIDGRNAILAADQAIYGGAHECLIWDAFARRGLGFSADQGSSASRFDGVEAFDVPPILLTITNDVYCNTEGPVVLSGGVVSGGVYSGPGVTDDGNGSTFTFDPGTAGVGVHVVSYNANDCSGTPGSDTATITVTDGDPLLNCQDITVDLDASGNATIEWSDVVTNSIPGGYAAFAGTYAPESFTGTNVSLGDDNGTAALPIGFDFEFYDTTYTEFYIASNGFVSFTGNGMTGPASWTPAAIPTAAEPNGMIAVVWDDISPNQSGTIKYGTLGTAPNRKLVVEYLNVPHYPNGPATISAQLHLFEGSNRIEIHLIDVQSDGGNRVLGIENAAGDDGLAYPGGNLTNWNASAFTAVFEPQPDTFALNCGNSVTVSLDKTDFTCDDAGVVPVTVTADDGNGGVSTCVANVTVNPVTTTYSGGIWSGGVPDAGTRAVIAQNYNTATGGDITACDCVVNSGRTLTVGADDFLDINKDITVNGTLIVEHQGIVVQRNKDAVVTNNGTINVEVTTPNLLYDDFMAVGSPMDVESRGGVFTGVRNVFYHTPANFVPNAGVTSATNFADDNADFWQLYTSGTINPGEAYLIFPQDGASGTVDLTFSQGTLNNGDVTLSKTYNGAATNPSGTPNIYANPYASPISAVDFLTDNGLNDVYFWEHITAPSSDIPGPYNYDYSMDDISIYNRISGGVPAANDTGSSTQPNGVISTAQGFGVLASSNGSVTFTNSMRLTSGNTTLRDSDEEYNRLLLRVSNNDYEYPLGSNMLIAYHPEATDGLDAGDTNYLDTTISLYSHLDDTNKFLTIQSLEEFNQEDKVLLGFNTVVEASLEYTIDLTQVEGADLTDRSIYLIDNLLGVITDLTEESYVFRANPGQQPGRFTLQFERETLSTAQSELEAIGMYPNPTDGLLNIISPRTPITQVVIYDLQGREVYKQQMEVTNQVSLNIDNLQSSLYMVQISSENGQITRRLIKQ